MNKRILAIVAAAGIAFAVAEMPQQASAATSASSVVCKTRHYVTKYHPAHYVQQYSYVTKKGTHVTVKAHWVKAYTVLAHDVTTCK